MAYARSLKLFLPALAMGCASFFASWILAPDLMTVAALAGTDAPAQASPIPTAIATTTLDRGREGWSQSKPESRSSTKAAPVAEPKSSNQRVAGSTPQGPGEPVKTTDPLEFTLEPATTAPPAVTSETASLPDQTAGQAATPASASDVLFNDTFANYPDGLITNEYAHWNPGDAKARVSKLWEMTAGTLFAKGGVAWTGVPDSGMDPNPTSSNANNSAIFRLTTKRADFENVKVALDLKTHRLSSTANTPEVDWDGVHIFLRYQSQYHLYYASINRRDDTVIIKKKVSGGPSNGGTYHNLSSSNVFTVPYDAWQKVAATIKNNTDGSVTIQLFGDGKLVASATDRGTGGPPIRTPGKVGIRADNADIQFKNFTVTAL